MNDPSNKFFRKVFFSLLPLNGYLTLLRKLFFTAYRFGYLKKNPIYSWHYFVARLLQRGDIVIDIGANMGYYSTLFSKSVKEEGKVYCIEPVAPLYRQLKMQVGHRHNVCLIPYALGAEESEEAVIGVPAHLQALGYLRHGVLSLQQGKTDFDNTYSFPVKIRRGSRLFSWIDRIDYIKCDIEGQELTVFNDMKILLEQHSPMVQIEITDANFRNIRSLFYQCGYKGYKLIEGGLVDIEQLHLNENLQFDTLFVSKKYFDRIMPFLAGTHQVKSFGNLQKK
jgi:FkbM family methyltransferase